MTAKNIGTGGSPLRPARKSERPGAVVPLVVKSPHRITAFGIQVETPGKRMMSSRTSPITPRKG